jgi:hypothetical protein
MIANLGRHPEQTELNDYIKLKKTGSAITLDNMENSMNDIYQLFVEINELVSFDAHLFFNQGES